MTMPQVDPRGLGSHRIPDEFVAETQEFDPRATIGTTGLKELGGYVDEEFLNRLRGQNGVRYYREMGDNSPILAAAMQAVQLLVRQVEWRIEPANDTPAAQVEAEFIEGALEDMSLTMDDFISEVLSMLQFGWAYFEMLYKLRRGPDQEDPRLRSDHSDGKWGWRRFDIRAQDTLNNWVFGEDGSVLGMVQLDTYKGGGPTFIPMAKAMLFRTATTKGNPEGKSLFRPAVIPYHRHKRVEEFEVIGVERDLAGMPIFEVPFELLLDETDPDLLALRNKLETFVTQVRRDERWGGVIPSSKNKDGTDSGFLFKLLTTGGRRQIDTNAIVQRYESRMLMTFLAQFLILGQDKVGSFSLASSMTELFGVAIGTYMDIIASTFNRFGIRRLQELNGRPADLDPSLVHGDIERPDLGELGKYLVDLSTAGLLPPADDAMGRKVLEVADMPIPEIAEDFDEGDKLPGTDDDTFEPVPTGANGKPVLSPENVKTVLEVTRALKLKELDREAAISLIASALGIDVADAEAFVPAEVDETDQPIPPGMLGGPPVPPPAGPPILPPGDATPPPA